MIFIIIKQPLNAEEYFLSLAFRVSDCRIQELKVMENQQIIISLILITHECQKIPNKYKVLENSNRQEAD